MHQSSSHKSLSLSLLAFIASLTLNLAAPAGAQAVCGLPPAGDADCDGMVDALDPCPSDTLNRCSGGTIATCETAPPGDQDCTAGEPLRLDIGRHPAALRRQVVVVAIIVVIAQPSLPCASSPSLLLPSSASSLQAI